MFLLYIYAEVQKTINLPVFQAALTESRQIRINLVFPHLEASGQGKVQADV